MDKLTVSAACYNHTKSKNTSNQNHTVYMWRLEIEMGLDSHLEMCTLDIHTFLKLHMVRYNASASCGFRPQFGLGHKN